LLAEKQADTQTDWQTN